MLKIFICEDNKDQRQSIERIVKNYLMMVDLDARLELSTDLPNDILKWRTQEQHDYLFLLDIELNHEMNGIILASQLRESYPHAKIVFITSHTEMAFLSFLHKVEALDIKLVIDDILFFETTPVAHKLSVHLLNRQLEFYANIKDISAYNSAFYRCHQSTVVNINNIEVVNTKTKLIQMIDGQKCNVSVRYLKGLLFKLKEKQKTLS